MVRRLSRLKSLRAGVIAFLQSASALFTFLRFTKKIARVQYLACSLSRSSSLHGRYNLQPRVFVMKEILARALRLELILGITDLAGGYRKRVFDQPLQTTRSRLTIPALSNPPIPFALDATRLSRRQTRRPPLHLHSPCHPSLRMRYKQSSMSSTIPAHQSIVVEIQ